MYKNKLILFILLLACISNASAWWNSDYENRREIQINNTLGSELTYYQVYVDLTDNPINSTSLRVINESSSTIIPHWQETIIDSNCTGLWFNATFLNANSWINETYYIYYNNSTVGISTNGVDTFIAYHGTSVANFLDNFIVSSESYIYENRIRRTASCDIQWGLGNVQAWAGDNILLQEHTPGNSRYVRCTNNGAHTDLSESPSLTTSVWYHGVIIYDGTTAHGYLNDDQITTGGLTTNLPNENMGLKMTITSGTGTQDWSFVRKYTLYEPVTIINVEEEYILLYIPPTPTNLDYSRGFFWVNHTWNVGTGNITDSYNVFHNGSWYNDTTNTYYNSGNIGIGGYSEILIYAYNNSGSLSEGYIIQNISTPPYVPPETPINLAYTKGTYWVNHTWDKGNVSFIGTYNVSHNGTWTNGSNNIYYNSGQIGRNRLSTIIIYAYNGILSEEYIMQTISTKLGIGYEQKMNDADIKKIYYPFMGMFFICLLFGIIKYVISR